MLFTQTLRRAAVAHLGLSRSLTSMASPQTFTLDRSLFNQTLYTRLREVWFQGLPEGATAAPYPVLQRWYGLDLSDEQKASFDEECRSNFEPALLALGPEKVILPPFTSHDNEIAHASDLSAPFLAELQLAQRDSDKAAADTFLSLILLLDQIPRNLYRSTTTLPLVYNHYDRLAFALFYASRTLSPDPISHPSFRGSQAVKGWFIHPLIHAEHLPSHQLSAEIMAVCRREAEQAGDDAAIEALKLARKAQEDHWEPLRRFGRYPHRNECLGRRSTEEEERFLETASTFGVKQSKKPAGSGKEEL